jgi:hypothetical protein
MTYDGPDILKSERLRLDEHRNVTYVVKQPDDPYIAHDREHSATGGVTLAFPDFAEVL